MLWDRATQLVCSTPAMEWRGCVPRTKSGRPTAQAGKGHVLEACPRAVHHAQAPGLDQGGVCRGHCERTHGRQHHPRKPLVHPELLPKQWQVRQHAMGEEPNTDMKNLTDMKSLRYKKSLTKKKRKEPSLVFYFLEWPSFVPLRDGSQSTECSARARGH